MAEKRCCFIGHRTIEQTDELLALLTDTIRRLILEEGVCYFLFGSRSAFDDLCHCIVTEFQQEFPNIVRVAYTRRSEYAVKAEEKVPGIHTIYRSLIRKIYKRISSYINIIQLNIDIIMLTVVHNSNTQARKIEIRKSILIKNTGSGKV